MKKTVLITGGNAGIGFETARMLASKGYDVVISARSDAKAQEALKALASAGHPAIGAIVMELSDPASVRAAAADFTVRFGRLDVLINNAGGYYSDLVLNSAGVEMVLAANHLGPFLLTRSLMPLLQLSTDARVINVASIAHKDTRTFDFDDINYQRQRYTGWGSYSRSKFCNILMARELAARFGSQGLMAFSLHPGGVRTQIAEKNSNWFTALGWRIAKPFFITAEQGALTSVHLASAPREELLPHNGQYFYRSRRVNSNRPSQDMALAARLWDWSEKMCLLTQ
jgi:NAD(P)-dependent dehydrogenase (short-subunit alcohol dehydrogenase family)